jgi:Icc-related predicted phosphoesterase
MRILIISDIHGSVSMAGRIARLSPAPDLVLLAGDITDFGGESSARTIMLALADGGGPLAAVSGNCDRDGVRSLLENEGWSVEGRCRTIIGLRIAGTGGGLHRRGLTPFEQTEDELEESLRGALSENRTNDLPLVILTHTPPSGTSLDRRGNSHVGSMGLGAVLDETAPLLWVSGHIHESRSVSVRGRTTLVNPGALHDGYYATATLEGGAGDWKVKAELHALD